VGSQRGNCQGKMRTYTSVGYSRDIRVLPLACTSFQDFFESNMNVNCP